MTTHRDSIEDIYDKLTHFPNYVNTICLESIDLVRYCAMTTNSRCFKIGDGVCGIYVDVRWNSSIWQAVKVLKYRKLTSIFEKTISASLWRISDGMERWKHPCGLMMRHVLNDWNYVIAEGAATRSWQIEINNLLLDHDYGLLDCDNKIIYHRPHSHRGLNQLWQDKLAVDGLNYDNTKFVMISEKMKFKKGDTYAFI